MRNRPLLILIAMAVGSTVFVAAATALDPPIRPVSLVPGTIDPTGRADVTVPLNAFLASVPAGSTIVFPRNARYRIEGTVMLQNKNDILVQGEGATFFATTDGLGVPKPGCSWTQCRFPNRTRVHWAIDHSTNIWVRNLNVVGSARNTGPNGTYDASLEAQHAFEILGSTNVVLDQVSGRGVWGDLVYVGLAYVRPPYVPRARYVPSSHVLVANSTFRDSSRQGWTVTNGQYVTFYNNTVEHARRSLIDIEANSVKDVIAYITIKDNRLGGSRFCTFTNHGEAAVEHDFVIADNHLIGSTKFAICVKAFPAARRSNYEITGNVGSTRTPNEPLVVLDYVDNVLIKDNVQGFWPSAWPWRGGPNGSPQAPVTALCSSVVMDGNHFPRPAGMPELRNRRC